MSINAPLQHQKITRTAFASILFALMLCYFNGHLQAQNDSTKTTTVKNDQENVLNYVITKDTDDKQLDLMKSGLSKNGISVEIKKVKRNSKDEITSIKVEYTTKNESGKHVLKANRPIEPFVISLNTTTKALTIHNSTSKLSQTLQLNDKETADTINGTGSQEDEYNLKNKKKEALLFAPDFPRNINLKDQDRKILFLKDGKATNYTDIITIDPDDIATVIVLKDKNDIEKYGKKGEDGVILISTKIKSVDDKRSSQPQSDSKKNSVGLKNPESVLYLLNGQEITYEDMKLIDADQIASVEVLKDKKAIEKFGSKAKDGVVSIHTKKD